MYEILVVEDDEDLLGDLKELIETGLPGTQVFTAETVDEALAKISKDLTLAVIDIQLPMKKGKFPRAHMEVPNRLRECNIPSICITGHAGTADVEEYLKKRQITGPSEEVIPKSIGPQFPKTLIGRIKRFLEKTASSNVLQRLHGFFGSDISSHGVTCGTGPLLCLQQQIIESWPYLDCETRKEVQNHFWIVEDSAKSITELKFAF